MSREQVGTIFSDEILLDLARKGDQNAFREILERHQSAVARIVAGMLGNTSEVDEVVQVVFIRFYKTLHQFRGDAACRTYLTRIAINASLDVLRRRKKILSKFISLDDKNQILSEPIDSDSEFDRFDQTRLINLAMNQLKPHHRAVVVLRLIDGYSIIETAEILGIAQGTVMSRLSRATTHLRTILGSILEKEN